MRDRSEEFKSLTRSIARGNAHATIETSAVIEGKTDPERRKGSTFTPSPKSRAKLRSGAQFSR